MKYIYMPDTYNEEMISSKFSDEMDFLNAQKRYRSEFEKILKSIINFKGLDDYIRESNIDIPILSDKEYNFYHTGTLESNYIYFRNNVHVEKLDPADIEKIKSNEELDSSFFSRTLETVFYDGKYSTFFGAPMPENSVNCRSLVFEFSYDKKLVKELDQLFKIEEVIKKISKLLSEQVKDKLKLDVSFIVYDGIPDYFIGEKEELAKTDNILK